MVSLWQASASRNWPGNRQFVIFVTASLVLLAFIEVVIGEMLASILFTYQHEEVQCFVNGTGVTRRPPITILYKDSQEAPENVWTLGEPVPKISVFFLCMFIPITSLCLAFFALFSHSFSGPASSASTRSLSVKNCLNPFSNRQAFLFSICCMLDWCTYLVLYTSLDVDTKYAPGDAAYKECWVDKEVAGKLWAEHSERQTLRIVRNLLSIVGVIFTGIYMFIAIQAVIANTKMDSQPSQQAISSDSPSAHIPNNNDSVDIEMQNHPSPHTRDNSVESTIKTPLPLDPRVKQVRRSSAQEEGSVEDAESPFKDPKKHETGSGSVNPFADQVNPGH